MYYYFYQIKTFVYSFCVRVHVSESMFWFLCSLLMTRGTMKRLKECKSFRNGCKFQRAFVGLDSWSGKYCFCYKNIIYNTRIRQLNKLRSELPYFCSEGHALQCISDMNVNKVSLEKIPEEFRFKTLYLPNAMEITYVAVRCSKFLIKSINIKTWNM